MNKQFFLFLLLMTAGGYVQAKKPDLFSFFKAQAKQNSHNQANDNPATSPFFLIDQALQREEAKIASVLAKLDCQTKGVRGVCPSPAFFECESSSDRKYVVGLALALGSLVGENKIDIDRCLQGWEVFEPKQFFYRIFRLGHVTEQNEQEAMRIKEEMLQTEKAILTETEENMRALTLYFTWLN